MIMIVLKTVLAVMLTAVPFLFHFWVKPKSATPGKWHSSLSFLLSKMPTFRRWYASLKAWLCYVYKKMYRSDNGRKFFILVLIIVMLVYQVVDYHSAKMAYGLYAESSSLGKSLSLTPYILDIPWIGIEVEFGPKAVMGNLLYPFQTHVLAFLVAMGLTLPLFSYRLADRILLGIHKSLRLEIILAILAILMAAVDFGRFFLLSEMLFILLLAGMVYPFKEQPSSPKGRCRWWDVSYKRRAA